jgi:hypothetical protein
MERWRGIFHCFNGFQAKKSDYRNGMLGTGGGLLIKKTEG